MATFTAGPSTTAADSIRRIPDRGPRGRYRGVDVGDDGRRHLRHIQDFRHQLQRVRGKFVVDAAGVFDDVLSGTINQIEAIDDDERPSS